MALPNPATTRPDIGSKVDELTFGAGGAQRAPVSPPRFQRLLVAVDGSPQSWRGVLWAADLARRFGASVNVVHVLPEAVTYTGYEALGVGDVRALLREEENAGKSTLDVARREIAAAGAKVDTILTNGPIVGEIARVARDMAADLVIIGSHGWGEPDRMLLGSVGNGVKDYVHTNVLLARNAPPARRILVAVDGSPESKKAAAAGLALARGWGAATTMLHVFTLPVYSLDGGPLAMERLVQHAAIDWGDDDVTARVVFGSAARGILEVADDEDADLIVVGSRGVGSFRGLLVGSVSNRVAHRSRTSVLLVRERAPDAGVAP